MSQVPVPRSPAPTSFQNSCWSTPETMCITWRWFLKGQATLSGSVLFDAKIVTVQQLSNSSLKYLCLARQHTSVYLRHPLLPHPGPDSSQSTGPTFHGESFTSASNIVNIVKHYNNIYHHPHPLKPSQNTHYFTHFIGMATNPPILRLWTLTLRRLPS